MTDINNIELFEVVPNDYKKIKEYFKKRQSGTCENVITDCYIWRNYYQTRYFLNDYGLMWIYHIKDEVFSSVPLCEKEHLKECFEDLRSYFNNVLGEKLKLYLVDSEAVEVLGLDESKYKVEKERDYFDYVYNAKELMTLPGKKYHKKKNHVNAFLKEYGDRYEIKFPTCEDKEEILAFLDRWHNQRNIVDEYNRDYYELKGIEEVLNNCHKIKYYMMCIYIDGKMEAFTLGTYLKKEKTVYVHVEKANPEIRGLYPFINMQFLVNCFPDARYVNREDDMGLEGLRKAKMSYNPEYFVEKYTITEL